MSRLVTIFMLHNEKFMNGRISSFEESITSFRSAPADERIKKTFLNSRCETDSSLLKRAMQACKWSSMLNTNLINLSA
ncbi:hypothetical protein DM828_29265 [Pseudomonas umsongensis]|jgi:hypothetical protein|nr:hypothetical protein [Pseudomonas umsongensis]